MPSQNLPDGTYHPTGSQNNSQTNSILLCRFPNTTIEKQGRGRGRDIPTHTRDYFHTASLRTYPCCCRYIAFPERVGTFTEALTLRLPPIPSRCGCWVVRWPGLPSCLSMQRRMRGTLLRCECRASRRRCRRAKSSMALDGCEKCRGL